MDENAADESSRLRPQFIFGPLGNGYRLSKRQRRLVNAIGMGCLIPGLVLLVLAKMKVTSFEYGIGGFVLLPTALAAMKIYVAAARVPFVPRRRERADEDRE